MKHQKGSIQHRFVTLEEHIKKAPWGDTQKIRILGQEERLEAGEELLFLTKIPYQLPTNLNEVEKDVV